MTNRSLQGKAELQEWRKLYNPKRAEELALETKRALGKVVLEKNNRVARTKEPAFSI